MFPKQIEEFLIKNEFEPKGEDEFFNERCSIVYHKEKHKTKFVGFYEFKFEDGSIFSRDENIYYLIGVLTYYNLINKNYKT